MKPGRSAARRYAHPTLTDLSDVPVAPDLVTIEAPDLCKRYSAVIMDGLEVAPSPPWLARRLQAAGVRPVNNLVDVTNYVMLELGQPMHAFDLSYIEGEKIVVRMATDKEPFETLDHRQRELLRSDLLICDAAKPIGIAGVMGGVNSEITDATTSILIESANFDMVSVRRSARQHKLQTDASARFGRGLDPELCGMAAARAVALYLELCPGSTIRTQADVYPNPEPRRSIEFPTAKVESLLGMAIDVDTMRETLRRLGFEPSVNEREIRVVVPTWRSDVQVYQDVIEEIARIVGYDHLPATLIEGASPHVERDATYLSERRVRAHLVAAGLYEGRGYVTYSPAIAEQWSLAVDGFGHEHEGGSSVTLRNAIPADNTLMRISILPNLVNSVLENLKHESSVRMFEIGHTYLPTQPNELPREPSTVAIAMSGRRDPFDRFAPKATDADMLDYFDAKGLVDSLLGASSESDVQWLAFEHPALHPGRSAMIHQGGERLGIVAEVHPALAAELGFEHRVAVAELNLEKILELRSTTAFGDVKVPRFLPVEQDFAVVVDRQTSAAAVQRAISANAGPLLSGVALFDVFEGPSIGEGKKSLAYRLTFTAPDRALTDAELGKVRKRLERGLASQVGGALRT